MKNLIFLRLLSQGLMSDFLLETVDLRQSALKNLFREKFSTKLINTHKQNTNLKKTNICA
jgi:hypothetical protein